MMTNAKRVENLAGLSQVSYALVTSDSFQTKSASVFDFG